MSVFLIISQVISANPLQISLRGSEEAFDGAKNPFGEPFPCTGRYLPCARKGGIGILYVYISEKDLPVAAESEPLQSLRISIGAVFDTLLEAKVLVK
jgi:hypothetical protein